MDPVFFPTPAAFGKWLAEHHATVDELLVGFYKKGTGEPSLTWPESVDEALCYGWIDGIRRTVDDRAYTIRFTPRRPGSTWSERNLARARELIDQGRMRPAGLAAYEVRRKERSGGVSRRERPAELPEPYRRLLRQDKAAWAFYRAQPPSYRKTVNGWVTSAKREETRLRRLAQLAACSARGERIPQLARKPSPPAETP